MSKFRSKFLDALRRVKARQNRRTKKSETRAERAMFEAMGITSNVQQQDRNLALRAAALALFPKPGRRKDWTNKRLRKLDERFKNIIARNPRASSAQVYQLLQKKFYTKIKPATIRRQHSRLSPLKRNTQPRTKKLDGENDDWA